MFEVTKRVIESCFHALTCNYLSNVVTAQLKLQENVLDGCQQAFQTEKMAALAAMEKKNSVEIDRVLLMERRRAEVEMNQVRESYERREQETVEDLQSLEQLHREHYTRLVRRTSFQSG